MKKSTLSISAFLALMVFGSCEKLPPWWHGGRGNGHAHEELVYFGFGESTNGTNLYAIDPDGTHFRQLTNDTVKDWYPSWAPGGNSIVFSEHNAIKTMNMHTGAVSTLIPFDGENRLSLPNYSPNGRQILYMSSPDGPTDHFYIAKANGTDPIQISFGTGMDANGQWSSDGEQIVFERNDDVLNPMSNTYLMTMNADGTNRVRLTDNSFNTAWMPDWSPTGDKIVFSGYRGSQAGLFIINADGTGLRHLSGTDRGVDPCWSPDGTKIAFVDDATSGESLDIFVINVDGTGLTQVTHTSGIHEHSPEWGISRAR